MTTSRRFLFVSLEFPWELGPDPGRYTIRERLGEPPAHVLVLSSLSASQRHLLPTRRRARQAQLEPPPAAVPTSRATLIDTTVIDSREDAERRLREADLDALTDAAVARLNRVLHAHRVAVADPYAREVSRAQAIVVRIGYGGGERVADGRWDSARELPADARHARRRGRARSAALRPQERLAALLAGRDAALASEELALRARADVDAGRWREAALQLRAALDAALAELEPWREQPGIAARIAELRARCGDVTEVAQAALKSGLDERQIALVVEILGRVESALRARVAGGRF